MKKILAACVAVIALAGYAYIVSRPARNAPAAVPHIDYSTILLTKPYTNDEYKFSLSMPSNFEVRQLADDGSSTTAILVESADRSDGVQIMVTPFDEEITTLTQERIQQDVPDLTITEPQPVEIGENNTGLAFKSDNEAFDGASREVWFVFRDNLYQISTYDRLDPLLKKIFSTWKFY